MFSGGYSTSSSYRLFGAISQISIGTSTATNFNLNSGFLYFPFASSPAVSATVGDGQVSLSWSISQGFLGWNVSGYNIGQSTISGGPYIYTSLGNVTSSTRTGLTNGTTYYFVVRAEDAFGNSIATSTEVSATPKAAVVPPTTPVSPGGGGGYAAPATGVVFSGKAYPGSNVILLKDAQLAVKTIAGPDSKFEISLSGLAGGDYNFSLYGEDKNGIRSPLFTFFLTITSGATTNISGIFIAPTIAVDKKEVKRGDNITIFGQSASQADIVISVSSEEEFFTRTISDKDGIYLYNFDTSLVDYGTHHTKSKASIAEQLTSNWSYLISFKVGTQSVAVTFPIGKAPEKGDLNNDKRVNIIDFSIAAYWYKRESPPAAIDFNGDGKVDLVDFSIMAYYWTG